MVDIFETIKTGGDYTTIIAWQAAHELEDLVATTTKYIGLISGIITHNDVVYIVDAVANTQFHRVLTHASGQKHTGTSGTGARVLCTSTTPFIVIDGENFVHFSGIEFNWGNRVAAQLALGVNAASSGVVVDSCLMYNTNNYQGITLKSANCNIKVINSIFFDMDLLAFDIEAANCSWNFDNNIVYNCNTDNSAFAGGIIITGARADFPSTVHNNLLINNGVVDYLVLGSGNLSASGNASSDTSAYGLSTVKNLTTGVFKSVAVTNINLRPSSSGAGNINLGIPISSFNYDIVGVARPNHGVWDIGAFEFEFSPIFYGTNRRYITQNTNILPMSGIHNFSNSQIQIPTGLQTPAIQARNISDTLTTLDSQLLFIVPSGVLVVASGLVNWPGIQFTAPDFIAFSGFYPSDVQVSGKLQEWLEPSGFVLNGDTASGVITWERNTTAGILKESATKFTQSLSGLQPSIASGVTNGLAAIWYNDGKYIPCNSANNLGGNDAAMTLIMVFKQPDIINRKNQTIWGAANASSTVNFISIGTSGPTDSTYPNGTIHMRKRDGAAGDVNLYTPADPVIANETTILSIVHSGIVTDYFKNGRRLTNPQSGMNIGTTTPTRIAFGALFRSSAVAFCSGLYIFESMVFTSGLTFTHRENLENYLSWKYQVPMER